MQYSETAWHSVLCIFMFSWSLLFSRSVVFESFRLCGLHHARPPCPSPAPGAYSNSCLLHYLLELAQTHVLWVGDAIQPSHPLSSPSPPAFSLPSIRVFSSESGLCIRWPKSWSFSFGISPSSEYSGLISFRRAWLDLLAVQGTLQSSRDSCLCCVFLCTLPHGTLTYLASEIFRKKKRNSTASLSIWLLYWIVDQFHVCACLRVCVFVAPFPFCLSVRGAAYVWDTDYLPKTSLDHHPGVGLPPFVFNKSWKFLFYGLLPQRMMPGASWKKKDVWQVSYSLWVGRFWNILIPLLHLLMAWLGSYRFEYFFFQNFEDIFLLYSCSQ